MEEAGPALDEHEARRSLGRTVIEIDHSDEASGAAG
jgi:hypothetical protein